MTTPFRDCGISLTGPSVDPTHLLGHRQVTNAHLLALAVHHGGRLATLDQRIDLDRVPGAGPEHLRVV